MKQITSAMITNFRGLCPLTFDGAFGVTKAKHSLHLCSVETVPKSRLFEHFVNTHSLRVRYAKLLVKAIVQGQDPKMVKVFKDHANIIKFTDKILCPFKGHTSNPFRCHPKRIPNTPCYFKSMTLKRLIRHLSKTHHLTDRAIQYIVDDYETDPATVLFDENDIIVEENYLK